MIVEGDFERDGVVCVRGAFDAEDLQEHRFDRIQERAARIVAKVAAHLPAVPVQA